MLVRIDNARATPRRGVVDALARSSAATTTRLRATAPFTVGAGRRRSHVRVPRPGRSVTSPRRSTLARRRGPGAHVDDRASLDRADRDALRRHHRARLAAARRVNEAPCPSLTTSPARRLARPMPSHGERRRASTPPPAIRSCPIAPRSTPRRRGADALRRASRASPAPSSTRSPATCSRAARSPSSSRAPRTSATRRSTAFAGGPVTRQARPPRQPRPCPSSRPRRRTGRAAGPDSDAPIHRRIACATPGSPSGEVRRARDARGRRARAAATCSRAPGGTSREPTALTYGLGEVHLLAFDPDAQARRRRSLGAGAHGRSRAARLRPPRRRASSARRRAGVERQRRRVRQQLDPNESSRWAIGAAALLLLRLRGASPGR